VKLTSLLGKKVYSLIGKYIGNVADVTIDLKDKKVTKLDVDVKLPSGEEQRIVIPYQWLSAIKDIVLVKKEIRITDEKNKTEEQ